IKAKTKEREREKREAKKQEQEEAKLIEVEEDENNDFLVKMDEPSSTTRPPDFFMMMPEDGKRDYIAAIDQVIGLVKRVVRPQMLDEMEQLYCIGENGVDWSSGWNGAAYWNITLDRSFKKAVENDCVEQWREHVHSHTTSGHALLVQLQLFNHHLPHKHWKLRELWRLQLEVTLCTVKYSDFDSAKDSDDDSTSAIESIKGQMDMEDNMWENSSSDKYVASGDMWEDESSDEYIPSDEEEYSLSG
ncbi:hypothetical protein DXG01_004643, partial [Tephrocybe rancida]